MQLGRQAASFSSFDPRRVAVKWPRTALCSRFNVKTSPLQFSARLVSDLRAHALACGALLGWAACEIASATDAEVYGLAMALLMLGAGTLAFTAYALHRAVRASRYRFSPSAWIVLVGTGVLLALAARNGTLIP
jgi:hypothetical protein